MSVFAEPLFVFIFPAPATQKNDSGHPHLGHHRGGRGGLKINLVVLQAFEASLSEQTLKLECSTGVIVRRK